MALDNSILFRRFQEGDKESFEILAANHFEATYYHVLSYAKCKKTSITLVEEIFLQLWKDRSSYDADSDFASCLKHVCCEYLLDYLYKVANNDGMRRKINAAILKLQRIENRKAKDSNRQQEFIADLVHNNALQSNLIPRLSTTEG